MVRINGEELELDGTVLADYLEENQYSPARIAVERNEEIVPKEDYGKTVFCSGDVIEIVCFVGGG